MNSDTSNTNFRPRQTSYLRIGPGTVLQFILYIDPAHTQWMNMDVLERLLFALKDRIPEKLKKENMADLQKGTGQPKVKSGIEVWRGTDYQIAYYFRKSVQHHAVLLKDKQMIYPEVIKSPSATPQPRSRRSPSFNTTPRTTRKRTLNDLDLTREEEGDEGLELETEQGSSSKRVATEALEEVRVKDEDDDLMLPPPPPLGAGAVDENGQGEQDYMGQDVKPTLKVAYTGFSIYGRALVVIVEPWPPLDPTTLPRPSAPVEIRQLSASVQPESFRRSESARPRRNPASTPLFRRSETTPLEEGDEGVEEWKERSRSLVRDLDEEESEEEEEELPSATQILKESRKN